MENAFGILANRLRVLLGGIEQKPKIVTDIALICVVWHKILRTHQADQTGYPPQQMNKEVQV